MSALFITVLNMSIMGGIVALAVIFARILLKKAPKLFSYALWSVVLFRLICPFSFESVVSLLPTNPEPIPQDIVTSQNPAIQTGIHFVDERVNAVISDVLPSAAPTDNSPNLINTVLETSGYIWLLIALALVVYAAIGYIRLRRNVCYATRVCGNIYKTDKIRTPFVLGFIHPKIYIPTVIDPVQHDYIIQHEQIHIKRLDYIIKPLAFVVFALHWFNPLIWAAYFLMSKDMEMSCDEAVLRKSGNDIRGMYSTSLLNLSVKKVGLLSPIAFGKSDVRSRIKNVLKFKKPAKWILVVSFITVAVFLVGFSSNKAFSLDIADDLLALAVPVTVPVSDSAAVNTDKDTPIRNSMSDEVNLKLYKITSKINTKLECYDHRYTICGTFTSWSEAQNYFADTYSIKTEILTKNIVPKSKYWESMNFATYKLVSGFSFKGLGISVETDQETVYYLLMDISTFEIFEPDKNDETQLLNELESEFGSKPEIMIYSMSGNEGNETTLSSALNVLVKEKWENENEHFLNKKKTITLK